LSAHTLKESTSPLPLIIRNQDNEDTTSSERDTCIGLLRWIASHSSRTAGFGRRIFGLKSQTVRDQKF
jgi:hypothetical protein